MILCTKAAEFNPSWELLPESMGFCELHEGTFHRVTVIDIAHRECPGTY